LTAGGNSSTESSSGKKYNSCHQQLRSVSYTRRAATTRTTTKTSAATHTRRSPRNGAADFHRAYKSHIYGILRNQASAKCNIHFREVEKQSAPGKKATT
jgi:hypothetical protein